MNRTLRALLFAFALGGAMVATAVASVQETTVDTTEEGVAQAMAPRVGDAGIYASGEREVGVTWIDDAMVPDANGEPTLMNRLHVWYKQPASQSHEHAHGHDWQFETVSLYDPHTGAFYGHVMESDHHATRTDENDQTTTTTSIQSTRLYHSLPVLCGLLNPANHATASSTGPCLEWDFLRDGVPAPSFIHAAGGLQLETAEGVRLTMDRASSMPTSILMPEPHGGEWTLTHFERGDGPLLQAASAPIPDTRLLERSPAPDWRLDTTGVSLELELADAYEAVQSEFSSYFTEHPDAALVRIWGTMDHDESIHQWQFTWNADGASLRAFVLQYPMVSPSVAGVPSQAIGPDQRFIEGDVEASRAGPTSVSQLPANTPTLAAAIDAWATHGPGDLALTGVYYDVRCNDAECTAPVDYLHVSHNTWREDGSNAFSELVFAPADRPHQYSSNLDPATGEPVFAEPDHWHAHDDSQLANALAPFTASPEAAAAAAGTTLLAALFGWFWPAIKATLVTPLFSRIQQDRLLEHPIRESLHDALRASPGLHIESLVRQTQLPRGTVRHHLGILERAGFVRATQDGRKQVYQVVPDLLVPR